MTIERWYFEDLSVGDVFTSPGRTITETDVVAFAGLSGDFMELHTNAEYAANSPFGRRIAHGLLGTIVASGLFTRTEFVLRLGTHVVALLGLEWAFKGPLFLDDTVHLEVEVTEARETKNPERGIVIVERRLVNQMGEVVQIGTTPLMIQRKAA